METTYPFVTFLTAILPHWIHGWDRPRRDLLLHPYPDHLFQVLWFLKYHSIARFSVLMHLAGVDYPSRAQRVALVYTLLSVSLNTRIRLRTTYDELTPICSVSSLFPTADWWEREVWDMFGVHFSHHPDCRRILTDYGFDWHPLRKEFPLSGYVHVRYDDSDGRIVTAPIEMNQEYRYFDLACPWADPSFPVDPAQRGQKPCGQPS
uniref:NADH dehydrogenase [ubiquinone] iron-sulfur protein 3 n=1 Tax=Selaginella moellendorffii TaxID=88036 RepID=F2YI97_SELML|nr:NADH dehydrogenase subunit 9 [Selaginella moellendorffii]AEA29870.1 NADH dehydrogenase subunit 9 [Selaginella moellendorffii]